MSILEYIPIPIIIWHKNEGERKNMLICSNKPNFPDN